MTKDLAIGIDIGGTNMRCALVDPEGKIVRQTRTASGAAFEARETAGRLIAECRSLVTEASASGARVRAVGLGVAGRIERESGRIVLSPNLPRMNGYALAPELADALGTPVVMENDADCFGIGESLLGAGRSIANWVGLTLGTGVGGCLIFGGRLWRGDHMGGAGELGHMVIVPGGRTCLCGARGCLEAYASGRALVEGMREGGLGDVVGGGREAGPEGITPENARGPELIDARSAFDRVDEEVAAQNVHRLALQGDPLAQELFRRLGWAIGLALSNLFTALGVRHAIIGGGVSAGWDRFIGPLMESLAGHATMFDGRDAVVRRGALGDEAALLGAALAAWGRVDEG